MIFLFGLLLIGLVNACDDSQRIMRISSTTNAHGEIYNGVENYGTEICYDELFGIDYNAVDPHVCTANNRVIRLSSNTNGHGEGPEVGIYSVDVCYGNLVCAMRSDCESDEVEVLSLSSSTNAHLGIAGEYTNKICCESSFGMVHTGICVEEEGGTIWSDGGVDCDPFNAHNSEYCRWGGWSGNPNVCCPFGYGCVIPESGNPDCTTGIEDGCGCQLNPDWCNEVLSCSGYRTQDECIMNDCDVIASELNDPENHCNEVGELYNISCNTSCSWNGTNCGFNSYRNNFDPGVVVVNPEYQCSSSTQLGECISSRREIIIKKVLTEIISDTVIDPDTLDESFQTWCPKLTSRQYACGFEVELGFFGFWNFVSSLGLIFGVYFVKKKYL